MTERCRCMQEWPCPDAEGQTYPMHRPMGSPASVCPHDDGPYHMWECDGPFTVSCANCGADGRITITSLPEEFEEIGRRQKDKIAQLRLTLQRAQQQFDKACNEYADWARECREMGYR